MINPYYFTDGNLQGGFNLILENHKIKHANFILTNIPMYPDFGIKTRFVNK